MADTSNGGMDPKKKAIIPVVIPSPVKVFTSNIGRGRPPTLRWEGAEWDIVECERILDTESYVRRAFRVKKNLFLKEGYGFTGANPERIQYLKRRFLQMEFATGVPFPVLLSQTISSLIRLSNAFWIKVRKESASGGKVRVTQSGKTLQPVAGYFIAPAHSMRFKRDEFGRITEYAQEINGKERVTFKPEDVIHWYFDKREGFGIGTPILVPVIDDIRALRRIEENLELLVYQHLFPLFHYQVGTPEAPASIFSDGTSEIDAVRMAVATMPSDGCWVTPERHTITPLQAGSSPVAVDKVIEHFKQRIFTGLGVSPVDMGEGGTASRSTAQTLSRNLIDDTKADQREFGALFYSYVIQELLLESTFSDDSQLDEENRVYLSFNEIDLESRIAKDNHYVDMFLKNAITHDELRKEIGKEPFVGKGWYSTGDGDWVRTNYGLIERDKVILQSIDEPGTSESKQMTAASANSAKNKIIGPPAKGGEGAIENKLRPVNQHGTRPAPKLNKDIREQNRIPALDIIYKQLPFEIIFKEAKDSIIRYIEMNGFRSTPIKNIVDMSFAEASYRLTSLCKQSYRIGLQSEDRYAWEVKLDKIDAKIQDHVEKYVLKLRDDLYERLNKNLLKREVLKAEDALFASFVFDAMIHRSAMVDDSEVVRAYNYGKVSGHRLNGFNSLSSKSTSDSDCPICKKHTLVYNETDVIIYEELPPFHPFCNCEMEVSR